MSKRNTAPEKPYLRESKRVRRTILVLYILLIIAVLIFPVFMNIAGGIGMCLHGGVKYGVMMFISSFIILTSVVLCFRKFNVTSIILCSIGLVICVCVTYKYTEIMMGLGKTDFNLKPRYTKYPPRHYTTVVVFVLLSIIALIQHFSYPAVTKRHSRRKMKKELEKAEAPRILGDD